MRATALRRISSLTGQGDPTRGAELAEGGDRRLIRHAREATVDRSRRSVDRHLGRPEAQISASARGAAGTAEAAGEVVDRFRAGEEVALHPGAAQPQQLVELGLGLDPLGRHPQAERCGRAP